MISLVADTIVDTLRSHLAPLLEPGRIGLCSPSGAGEDVSLGVYLYSAGKDKRYQMAEQIRIDGSTRQLPPLCLELGVMITPYIGRKAGLANDYKLLERILALWSDTAELPCQNPLQPAYVPFPQMELLSPDADAVSKIWQFPGVPYILSLFYKCAPVAVPSLRQNVTTRVGGVDYTAKEGGL